MEEEKESRKHLVRTFLHNFNFLIVPKCLNLDSGVYLRLNARKFVALFFQQLSCPFSKSCFAGAASYLA